MLRACQVCGKTIQNARTHCAEHAYVRTKGSAIRKQHQAILSRDHWECQLRLEGCTVRATTVDHIIPVSRGGGEEATNKRAACASCNTKRGTGW